jgi:hypothetical protein
VLDRIGFPPDMRSALTTHDGPKGRLLECIVALENGDFDRAQAIIPNAGELYLSSVAWADDAADPLFAHPQDKPPGTSRGRTERVRLGA